jgi:hypothetical protein
MTISRAILNRLAALEARKLNTYVPPPPIPLGLYLVGFFGGHYTPVQSPRENYALAIAGREKGDGDDVLWRGSAIRRFDKMSPEQVAERHNEALQRIFRRRKIDPDAPGPCPKVDRMLKQLAKSGLPIPAASWGVAPASAPV